MVSSRTNDLDTAWWGKSSPASTNHDRRASTNRRHGELFPFRISARQILAAVWSSRRTGGGKFSAAASTFARNICTGFSGSLFVLLKGFLLSLCNSAGKRRLTAKNLPHNFESSAKSETKRSLMQKITR
jgi:hypothetical protein